jgi:DEAD/DEAH box helicase domain-containing protein
MRKITFDIETRNLFQDVNSNDPAALDISVVCIHDSENPENGGYSSYLQEDFPKLWPVLERTDMLVTFNGDHFDIPLLDKYYPGKLHEIKSVDLMADVKKSLGRRMKLDSLAEATLGKKKIGHGLEAITWWRKGEIDKIIKYCLEDVKITKELYEYALAHGHLKYKDIVTNAIKEIPIDTSEWEVKKDHSMTFTLPF